MTERGKKERNYGEMVDEEIRGVASLERDNGIL